MNQVKQGNMLRKLLNTSYIIAITVVTIDLLTKVYALAHLKLGATQKIFFWLNYRLFYNKGIAFSIFNDGLSWQRWLFIGITIGVVSSLIIWACYLNNNNSLCAIGFIVGGAVGNLIDRINYGMVIDFIDVHYKRWHWPIFNIADAAICIGAFIITAMLIRDIKLN